MLDLMGLVRGDTGGVGKVDVAGVVALNLSLDLNWTWTLNWTWAWAWALNRGGRGESM